MVFTVALKMLTMGLEGIQCFQCFYRMHNNSPGKALVAIPYVEIEAAKCNVHLKSKTDEALQPETRFEQEN